MDGDRPPRGRGHHAQAEAPGLRHRLLRAAAPCRHSRPGALPRHAVPFEPPRHRRAVPRQALRRDRRQQLRPRHLRRPLGERRRRGDDDPADADHGGPLRDADGGRLRPALLGGGGGARHRHRQGRPDLRLGAVPPPAEGAEAAHRRDGAPRRRPHRPARGRRLPHRLRAGRLGPPDEGAPHRQRLLPRRRLLGADRQRRSEGAERGRGRPPDADAAILTDGSAIAGRRDRPGHRVPADERMGGRDRLARGRRPDRPELGLRLGHPRRSRARGRANSATCGSRSPTRRSGSTAATSTCRAIIRSMSRSSSRRGWRASRRRCTEGLDGESGCGPGGSRYQSARRDNSGDNANAGRRASGDTIPDARDGTAGGGSRVQTESTSADLAAGIAGQRVIITAGAGGIGLAIARRLAGHGARLFVCDVADAALDAFGRDFPKAGRILADVAVEADVERLFKAAADHLGGLDAMINNAGIAGPTGGVDEIDPADWRRTIDVCLTGQFLCTRMAVPMLKAAGGGSIVNLSSAAGRHGYAFRTPYSSAKFGVIGFTQSLAKELGPANIRVNAVLPGIVEGPRMEGVIRSRAGQLGIPYDEMEAQYLAKVSLRRMVTPDDVAAAIAFLLSDAGRNISGQSIGVDGNVEAL